MDLKKAIRAHGSTISACADYLGITQPSLTEQIKNGTIGLKRVELIAKFIGCSLPELVTDDNDNNKCEIRCPHCHKSIRLSIQSDGND